MAHHQFHCQGAFWSFLRMCRRITLKRLRISCPTTYISWSKQKLSGCQLKYIGKHLSFSLQLLNEHLEFSKKINQLWVRVFSLTIWNSRQPCWGHLCKSCAKKCGTPWVLPVIVSQDPSVPQWDPRMAEMEGWIFLLFLLHSFLLVDGLTNVSEELSK